jgi:hypothetical protein
MDLFVVPTLSFRLLYGFLILAPSTSNHVAGVTANPMAGWIAQQLTEACGWEAAPDYIVRDRDCALWRSIHPAGHSRPTNGTASALAECLY